ncbi:MAG: ribosomal-protein-alanine N-acetyltransferase [Flavobacteriaceae bacterium]|jgi:ribosomal-protein-alanine N-acetyltransferase
MNEILLETDRLILRKVTLDDIPLLFKMESTPESNEYTGEVVSKSIEELEEKIKGSILKDYRVVGFGRLAVIIKETNTFIGWAGLKYLPEFDQVDLGYRFLPEFWGKGYGTEASIELIRYGFEDLNLDRIIALAMPENKASTRIMEKAGMAFDKTAPYEDGEPDAIWYFIDRSMIQG